MERRLRVEQIDRAWKIFLKRKRFLRFDGFADKDEDERAAEKL
jgi:hypothetical protein